MKRRRPENWKKPDPYSFFDGVHPPREIKGAIENAYEAGADAMLVEVQPLLRQVYGILCGWRLEKGKTDYYSALDEIIDKLKPMVIIE